VDSKWPTPDEIATKRAKGETLTHWESSVYRLNFRDDGSRYSNDPEEREAQYEADNTKSATRLR
jgi:hypothetical protein